MHAVDSQTSCGLEAGADVPGGDFGNPVAREAGDRQRAVARVVAGLEADRSGLVAEVRSVVLEANWRGAPTELTYVFLTREPSVEQLVWAHRVAAGLPGVRVVSPTLLGWSALWNPLFFRAVAASGGAAAGVARQWTMRLTHGADACEPVLEWLRSMTFLAAVTLSAAIVQRRYSAGTLASKYDRLWQLHLVSSRMATSSRYREIVALEVAQAVVALARDQQASDVDRLLAIRRLFESAIALLARDVPHSIERVVAERLDGEDRDRFGFVESLGSALGGNIECLIAYGSSVSGASFNDYDLVLIVADPEVVLRRLAGTSPVWRGRELNLGVYSRDEFSAMQLLSGDNLATYGRCLLGEAEIPCRSPQLLQHRNLSFGLIRWRQQLGMLSAAVDDSSPRDGDDRRNLYDYFCKVPANVARGMMGTTGEQRSKDEIYDWMRRRCDYDPRATQALAASGDPVTALAAGAVASGRVLQELNADFALATTSQGDTR